MSNVALLLPPLVERNFGSIYPSTPVLAAFLQSRGIHATQIDLNTCFLDHILSERELRAGELLKYQQSRPQTSAAARWVLRMLHTGALSRSEFLHPDVADRSPLGNVLRLLTLPYTVDPGPDTVSGVHADPALIDSYERFFTDQLFRLELSPVRPALLGISVPMGPQLLPALLLAKVLAAAGADKLWRIVLGGPALSLLEERALTQLLEYNPAVDCIVRFDGEYPLDALARQALDGQWAPHRVPGTSSLHRGTALHRPPMKGPELNTLATPAYSPGMIAAAPDSVLGVIQARGCYWGKCDYCDFVEVYKGSPSVRTRSPERMVEDISLLVRRTGLRKYRLITDSIPPATARSYARSLIATGLQISWSPFAMVDRRFDAELLDQMSVSGCDHLVIGLESMVTRALKLVHKSADREENLRFLHDASAAGIRLTINLIPDLPGTTREEALRGLADLEASAHCVHRVSVFGFEATRSSRVGRSPTVFRLIPVADVLHRGQAQLGLNSLSVTDPAMNPGERREVFRAYRAFANRVNAKAHVATDCVDSRDYLEVMDNERHEGPVLFDFATMERIEFPPAC